MTETDQGDYGRWTLRDESTLNYGYFHKTGGSGISEVTAEKAFYLTTAINYTNGPAHMGHAYEATTSDAISRFHRLKGEGPVYFVTGADEHGQKIANTAADLGQEPIEICDKVRWLFVIPKNDRHHGNYRMDCRFYGTLLGRCLNRLTLCLFT